MTNPPRVAFPVVAPGRRVRLSSAHLGALFGAGAALTSLVDLEDEGLFAALETVTLKNGDARIEGVRVVGPLVDTTMVELPPADFATLGLPLPMTRRLEGSPGTMIEGPKGSVMIADGVIPQVRHLRVARTDAPATLLTRSRVTLRIDGDRARVMGDVPIGHAVDAHATTRTVLVVDNDDANALELNSETRALLVDG
jgi:putative phosphotransacetylase